MNKLFEAVIINLRKEKIRKLNYFWSKSHEESVS